MARLTQCPHCHGPVTVANLDDLESNRYLIDGRCPHCERSGQFSGGHRGPYIWGLRPEPPVPPPVTDYYLDIGPGPDDDDDLDEPAPSASPSPSGQESPPRRLAR